MTWATQLGGDEPAALRLLARGRVLVQRAMRCSPVDQRTSSWCSAAILSLSPSSTRPEPPSASSPSSGSGGSRAAAGARRSGRASSVAECSASRRESPHSAGAQDPSRPRRRRGRRRPRSYTRARGRREALRTPTRLVDGDLLRRHRALAGSRARPRDRGRELLRRHAARSTPSRSRSRSRTSSGARRRRRALLGVRAGLQRAAREG